MIALTQRLVERDEQIMALQDELDAYDRHHKELEEVSGWVGGWVGSCNAPPSSTAMLHRQQLNRYRIITPPSPNHNYLV